MADERMRELFLSGKTTDRAYRGETLGKLYADVRAKKNDIVGCLAGDLGRPAKAYCGEKGLDKVALAGSGTAGFHNDRPRLQKTARSCPH